MTPEPLCRGAIDFAEWDWAAEPPGPYLQPGDSLLTHDVAVAGGLQLLSAARTGAVVRARVQAPATLPVGTRCSATCSVETAAGRRWVSVIEIEII